MNRLKSLKSRLAQSRAAKMIAAGVVTVMTAPAVLAAEGDNPLDQFFDAINLSGTATKVAAVGLLIIAIALTFKGPDLAKRVIRKV